MEQRSYFKILSVVFFFLTGIFAFYKYVPLIPEFYIFFTTICLPLVILTWLDEEKAVIFLFFLLPLVNSFQFFFKVQSLPVLIFMLLIFIVIKDIKFVTKRTREEIYENDALKLWKALLIISLLLTIFRHSGVLYFEKFYDVSVNIKGVSTGEAIRLAFWNFFVLLLPVWFIFQAFPVLYRKKEILLKILLFSGTFSIFFAIFQEFVEKIGTNPSNRGFPNGLFSDSFALGYFAVFAFLLSLVMLLKERKFFYLPLPFLFLFGLFLSRSRAALTALIVGLAVLLAKALLKKEKVKPGLIIFILLGTILLSASVFTALKRNPLQKIAFNLKFLQKKNITLEKKLVILTSRRYYFWKIAFIALRQYPLAGLGIGSFQPEASNFFYKYNLMKLKKKEAYKKRKLLIDNANNIFLQLGSELGLIGVVVFLLLVLPFYRGLFSNWKENDWLKGVAAAFVAGTSFTLLFGYPIFNVEIGTLFWFLLIVYGKGGARPYKIPGHVRLLVIVVFSLSLAYSSVHSLSLPQKTRSLDLIHRAGTYPVEKDERGAFFWTGKRALIPLKAGRKYILSISTDNPLADRVKLEVYFREGYFGEKREIFKGYIERGKELKLEFLALRDGGLFIECGKTWVPAKVSDSPDRRELGVRVRIKKRKARR